jgi:non-lysosomal glucosylceramidase
MDDEGWELARGVAAGTYERGLAFRTPEAWDASGGFRSAMSHRAGSVWAIEHALTMMHRREVAAWEKVGRGRVKDEL